MLGGLPRIVRILAPNSGAMVMGTGIVSIALLLDGWQTLSEVLLAITAAVWIGLGLVAFLRLASERSQLLGRTRPPAVLTAVAGSAVLGTRLAMLGWITLAVALLVISSALWAGLLGSVLGGWRTPTVGSSFMLTVSTEALAVLAAALAVREGAGWLLVVALVLFALGLVLYLFVVARFDFRQLAFGRGDHWVSGGALAIAALAAGWITLGARGGGPLAGMTGTLATISIGLWTLAALWLPLLLAAELIRPRLSYNVHRWSTVFPLGMYAACSLTVGRAADAEPLHRLGRIEVWIATSIWAVVFIGLLRSGARFIEDGKHR
jgi:tellurite resistance protein TehA-like permease